MSNTHRSVVSARVHLSTVLLLRCCPHPTLSSSDCGNIITDGSTSVASSDCSFACTGNAAETCGAGNRLNMYWSGATPPPPPEVVPSVGTWKSLGCYSWVS